MRLDTNDYQQLIHLRRHLHTYPEVSGQEYQTARFVASHLRKYQPTTLLEQIGGTGVVAIFDSGKVGKTLLFRAELDALPIQEVNDFAHRSIHPKVSHKCGHDGHTTILLGLAQHIAKQPIQSGKVILLFQPAEEDGTGAEKMLTDPKFVGIQPDYVFAFHNLPGYPLHQIVWKKGSFTAAVKSIIIELIGKTAHAAEPEKGINPALAITEILTKTKALSNNQPDRKDFAVITPIHIEMGSIAYGVSAGQGTIRLTYRTWTEVAMKALTAQILAIVDAAASKHQLQTKISWTDAFLANQNDDRAVDYICQVAKQQNLSITERVFPIKWGEDFGGFTQAFRGAMFGIGAGMEQPALHHPDYDFPDVLIPTGVELFAGLISCFNE